MSRFTRALRSSIGAKAGMALTGLALLGFVIAHMLGNLQVFAGREKLNAYAKTLQDLGPLLWVMRLGLLTIFVVHVATAWTLWSQNKAARGPNGYAIPQRDTSTWMSRHMMLTGLVVLAFVVYHVLHFTLGVVQPSAYGVPHDAQGRHDVWAMVIRGFQDPVVALSYVVAQVLLGLHLWHGASSVFQTLGFTSPRMEPVKRWTGPVLAAVIVAGNVSIPLLILLRLYGDGVR